MLRKNASSLASEALWYPKARATPIGCRVAVSGAVCVGFMARRTLPALAPRRLDWRL